MIEDPRIDESPEFADWLLGFGKRAEARFGRAPEIGGILSSIRLRPEILDKQSNQAEFDRSVGEYVAAAASESRVESGRNALGVFKQALDKIQGRFGVAAEIVAAIWGVESDYGRRMGGFPVLDALATLASSGSRKEFFEAELLAALEIVLARAGDPSEFLGSWAGAMGHTQFMPSSYLRHAIGLRGEQRPDIWGSDPSDALASAANLLENSGWKRGLPWAVEVELPDGFDYLLASEGTRLDPDDWSRRGVRAKGDAEIPDSGSAALLLPCGASGPALLATDNFKALLSYNRAVPYVIAVGHLSDRIAGRTGIAAPWPGAEFHLSRAEILKVQRALGGLGYDTGGIDGLAGPATRRSIQLFQSRTSLLPDGFPSRTVYDALCGSAQ